MAEHTLYHPLLASESQHEHLEDWPPSSEHKSDPSTKSTLQSYEPPSPETHIYIAQEPINHRTTYLTKQQCLDISERETEFANYPTQLELRFRNTNSSTQYRDTSAGNTESATGAFNSGIQQSMAQPTFFEPGEPRQANSQEDATDGASLSCSSAAPEVPSAKRKLKSLLPSSGTSGILKQSRQERASSNERGT